MAYSPTVTPAEEQSLFQQRATNRTRYLRGIAQNNYQYGQAKLDRSKQLQKFGISWGRSREALPGQFQGRGLMNSGIYQDALQNYGIDRQMAADDLTSQYQRQLSGLNMDLGDLHMGYTGTNLGIDLDEQTRRSVIAAALKSVM